MKLLFITDNYPPERNAPAVRTFEHVSQWASIEGNEITIITCFPNFPYGKVYEGYKNKIYSVEYKKGVRIFRVWSYTSSNSGTFKRILDFFSFSLSASILGLFLKSDIIIATSPQFFTTWAAFFIAKIKKVPWIFELRDLWPESIASVDAIKNRFILRLLEKIEILLYKDCNKVIAVTESFKENLISRGINKNKIEVITNGVSSDFFNKKNCLEVDLNLRNKLKNKFVIGYIGTHGMSQGLDFVLKSVKRINLLNLHFLFIGNGAEKNKLKELAQNLKIKNVTFINSIEREKLSTYYDLIDVSLVCLKKSNTFKKVIPSKIFEACAMNKPILLGVEGEAKRLIKKYNSGISYLPENHEDFAKKIKLIMERSTYNSLKKGCFYLAKNHNREFLALKMLKIIKEVYKSNI